MGATYTPRVMYHPSGQTRRVVDAQTEEALLGSQWAFAPFPPPPEPPKPKSIQEQLDELRDLVMLHDAVLTKRKK